METSLNEARDYETRARHEIKEALDHLQRGYLETALSTAYYSCFYAIHAQLARLGVCAKSHKQVGIEFRRNFIKTRRLDKKYSQILNLLFQWRETADYVALPHIEKGKASDLVKMAEDFVTTVLAVKDM